MKHIIIILLLALGACNNNNTTKVVEILETNEKVAINNLQNYTIGDTIVVRNNSKGEYMLDVNWIKFEGLIYIPSTSNYPLVYKKAKIIAE
jgi:hypothetical protein